MMGTTPDIAVPCIPPSPQKLTILIFAILRGVPLCRSCMRTLLSLSPLGLYGREEYSLSNPGQETVILLLATRQETPIR